MIVMLFFLANVNAREMLANHAMGSTDKSVANSVTENIDKIVERMVDDIMKVRADPGRGIPYIKPWESVLRSSSSSPLSKHLSDSSPSGASNFVRVARSSAPVVLTATSSEAVTPHLNIPAKRDEHYGSPLNVAKYLVDLHDASAVFDFCGGMMFQLVLSDKLRDHLAKVANGDGQQPIVFDASKNRMAKIPEYSRTAHADNIYAFHGREVRQVPHAAGGMGFVLQLSFPDEDPEGWTPAEIQDYDGWGHDQGRPWRNGQRLKSEGCDAYENKFGKDAFGLHHRFYLHYDEGNRLWLSAEDGCEGTPAQSFLDTLHGWMR